MNNTFRQRPINMSLGRAWHGLVDQRGRAFGLMILGALLAFEIFNFSTTEFALNDVLGELKFAGVRWATILSIAFCGIDFAGIARIFTPEQGADEPAEVWYLFGAWILAAAMNATLTWWGVSVAIVNHSSQGAAVVGNDTIQKVVPVFVAIMVWVIRILIIGTFSVAGERLFSMADSRPRRTAPQPASRETYQRPAVNHTVNQAPRPVYNSAPPRPTLTTASQLRPPAPRPAPRPEPIYRNEPTYHNLTDER
jgi:hypothetical protein